MNALKERLYKIANQPQAKLSEDDRDTFNWYLILFSDSAVHGGFHHLIFKDTPEEVISAILDNGFELESIGEDLFFSWKNPNGELPIHFYDIASSPSSTLSETDKVVYFEIVRAAEKAAEQNLFSIKLPSRISKEVKNALGVSSNDVFLSWDTCSEN